MSLELTAYIGHVDGKRKNSYRCSCGAVVVLWEHNVKSGHTQSCGCFQRKRARDANLTHGDKSRLRYAPEYICWLNMRRRCFDKTNIAYKHYGGRGITVCSRWNKSYQNFLADVGRKPGPEYSIDRVNNDGNYEPSNCRWATAKQQYANQRQNWTKFRWKKDFEEL